MANINVTEMNLDVSQFLELATQVRRQLQQQQEENSQLKLENKQLKVVNSELQAKLDRINAMNLGQMLQAMEQQNELQVSSTDQQTNNSIPRSYTSLSKTGSFETMQEEQTGNNSLQSETHPQVHLNQANKGLENGIRDDIVENGDEEDESDIDRSYNEKNSNKKPIDCHISGNEFSTRGRLLNHIAVHNGKRYICDIGNCYAFFTSRTLLNLHKGSHKGLNVYTGNERNRSIKSNLSKHLPIHNVVKPYPCNECNKSFKQRAHLSAHLRVHTGEKPYYCNECNKSFRQSSHLYSHLRIHTGEKPYCCTECNKSFVLKSNLTKHLRIHTGEKPYSCNLCHTSFRYMNSLSHHLQIHIVEKRLLDVNEKQLFSCEYCGQKQLKKDSLESHILMCSKNHSS